MPLSRISRHSVVERICSTISRLISCAGESGEIGAMRGERLWKLQKRSRNRACPVCIAFAVSSIVRVSRAFPTLAIVVPPDQDVVQHTGVMHGPGARKADEQARVGR